jgi:hypothetical protein
MNDALDAHLHRNLRPQGPFCLNRHVYWRILTISGYTGTSGLITRSHKSVREVVVPGKTMRKRQPNEVHTQLAIRTERYEACTEASINHHVYAPQYAWTIDENDPLYEFTTRLTIIGISIHPKERAGDTYELMIYGDNAASQRHGATLKDVQVRDERGSLQYRTYRGREVPVYAPPKGVGHLNKVRGESRWTAWFFVPTRFVNDMLVLLNHGGNLFMAIHERKDNRARWVQSITLQTNNPAEE